MEFQTNFTNLDWGIVAIYLIGSVMIGLFANRYIRNMDDYIVAGRSLRSFIAIATMLGSEVGLVTVMYTSQKGFTSGFSAFHIGLVAGIVPLLVGLTGFIVVPLRRHRVKTIPEYYGQRFGTGVRVLGGLILALAGIVNMGVFLKAGAIFVTALTGLHDPMIVNIVMTVLIVMVLIYTILGGMVSVVITDYIQFVVLSVGLLLTAYFVSTSLGWEHIVDTVHTVHEEPGFNPFDTGGMGLSYVLWMLFLFGIVSSAVWPTAVIRACAAESTKVVRRLYIFSSIGFMTRFIIPQFLGICALVYFWDHEIGRNVFFTPEGKVVENSELTLRAMPTLLAQILPPGAIGVICAGMLAAFMSTHDSYLLCWASVLVEDVANPLAGGKLTTKSRLLLARIFILLIAAFLLIWSLWYSLGQDMLDYLAVTGAVYASGAFALLLFGLYWKGASRVGAYLALVAGSLAVLALPPIREHLHLIEYATKITKSIGLEIQFTNVTSPAIFGLTAVAASIVLMWIGSLLFPDPPPKPSTEE